ncbi:hypothetical protein A3712_00285 [Vibrio sp. HI00D65]|uniref:HAD family hydrolase n=1 Tax=Vibrio sp. HI00D65 TaxID=1822216 RepID=UPI0007B7C7DC|nr:HAD-IB family hydrolase [Vibrio sp. HI00D65]KZX70647.1 hypothetical protein A3712_00285 [Vibrio sp. HI00D65]
MSKSYKYAFFDVDETVVSFKTMFKFLEFFYNEINPLEGQLIFNQYMLKIKNDWKNGRPREEINQEYYRIFSSVDSCKFQSIVEKWYEITKKLMGESFFINPIIDEINILKKSNTKLVFVSGSIAKLIELIARDLRVDYVLATRIREENGILTGEIIPPQTIGDGKAVVVEKFMKLHNVESNECIAYGDHISDFQMLSCVSDGVIVSKDKETISSAKLRGWRIIDNY